MDNPRRKKTVSPDLGWTPEELEEMYGEALSADMQDLIDQYDGLEFLDDVYDDYDNENFS
jgi:hypothetical protein